MSTKRLAVMAAVLILLLLFTTCTVVGQPVQPWLEVTPSTGRGRYGETVTVRACGLRPGATIKRIDFLNSITGQVYSYAVDVVVNEAGCFETSVVLGNMSYGWYNVIVYEYPPSPPEPMSSTAIIPINETGVVTVTTEYIGVNAVVEAVFSTLAFWDYRNYNYTTGLYGAVLGLVFTAEDGVNYTIIAWIADSIVYFRLLDAEGRVILRDHDEPIVCEAGVCTAIWEFNIGDPEVPGLNNNKALFTYYPGTGEIRLDLYYGGRKLSVIKASLNIRYENYDTGAVETFYYEYPYNMTFEDYGLQPITTPSWTDADIEWTARFEWNATTGEAILTVNAEYLPREIPFEFVYSVEPIVYLNGEPVESGVRLERWTTYEYLVELYGFTPGELFIVEVDGIVIYQGFIDKDGNASYRFTVPLHQLDRGFWYTVTITSYYSDNVITYEYVVEVLIAYPAIYVNDVLVEPDSTINLGYLSPGQSIVIEAGGFPPYTPLNLYLNNVLVTELVTDGYGNLYYVLTVGELPIKYGEQNVLTIEGVYGELKYTVYATFSVPAIYINDKLVLPDETVDLGYLYPKHQIKVEARGFPPYTPISIWVDNTLVGTFQTDETGTFIKVFMVHELPVSYGAANTLVIKAIYDTTEYVAYATFTVPAIYVNNILVKPGETVNLGYACHTFPITVEARGFPPYTPITLYLNGQLIGSFETDETGAFVGTFTVGELPFKYNATNTLTVLAVYNSVEYYAYADFTIPGIFINATLVGFDEVYDAGVIVGVKVFKVEAFNFPPNAIIDVYLDGNFVGRYYTDIYGYATILLDAHKSMHPGEAGVYTIIARYNGCTYVVKISFTIQEIYSYFKLINPITGETLTQPRASAGYYNKTEIVTLNGEPFDYLGDIIEIYIDGLGPGERVIVKLVRGLLELTIYDGVAKEDGTLLLELTVPSIPRGTYSVVAYLTERGYNITIPWSEDPEVKEFDVYPKIVVTRLETYEVPITVGSIAVRVFGSGFDENAERFIVLLNGTDAIAAVNYHTYAFWRTNEWGLLVGPGGSQTGLTIPVLEPGVYAITIYAVAGDYTAGTGYVIVVNNLANVATKEDIEGVMSALETISANLYEVLTRLDVVEATLSEVASNIMVLIDKQIYVIEILEELRYVVATKDDISNVMSYLELLEGRIDDLYLTMVALYEQLNVRLDDLEMYLATLISQLESKLLERTYELEDLMIYLYTLLQERIDSLELVLLSRLSEVENTLLQRIGEVEQVLTERLSNLELLVVYVYESLIARIDELEMYISSRLDVLELWLEELTTIVLEVHDSLQNRINELEETMANAIAELESSLRTRIDELESSTKEYVDEKTEYLASLIESLNATLTTELSDIRTLIEEKAEYIAMLVENVNATLVARISELENYLNTSFANLETLILNVNRTLTDLIDTRTEYLASLVRNVNATLVDMINNVTALVYERTGRLESLITAVNETLSTRIAGLEARMITEFDTVKAMISSVNATLTARIDRLEHSVRELVDNRTRYLETRIAEVNATLHAELDRLESLVLREVDALESLINTTSRELSGLINATASYIVDYISREIDALESQVVANMTVLGGVLKLYIDERISELNESIQATLRLHDKRLEYIEEALVNVTHAIEDLRSDMYTEVGRVRTELDVKHDEMSEKIGELDEKVGVAISTSEEARSLASTTMTISTITLILVVASLAVAVLTLMKLRKAR